MSEIVKLTQHDWGNIGFLMSLDGDRIMDFLMSAPIDDIKYAGEILALYEAHLDREFERVAARECAIDAAIEMMKPILEKDVDVSEATNVLSKFMLNK